MLFVVTVVTPVGLHEHGIDLFGINDFALVANGFDHRSDTEIFDTAQHAFAAASHEVHCRFGEGGVCQSNLVKLVVDELLYPRSGQGFDFDGVGDPTANVFVGPQLQGGVEAALPKEDEVVIFRKIFQQQAQLAQGLNGDEVGIVYYRDDEFAFVVEAAGFFD